MNTPTEYLDNRSEWPAIPYPDWRDTCIALHLYSQIVGKYRLAHTPWINHSWHATLYVSARGLTTGLIANGVAGIEVRFDFVDHRVIADVPGQTSASFRLEPMSVAEFHRRFVALIRSVGGQPRFHSRPNEVADPVRFEDDHLSRPYDAGAVERFHRALLMIVPVLQRFRTGFLGKVSPVHLFWGSFDLAVTRFSGRPAPQHPGNIPALPDEVTREAYSHEVSSAGFWPGGGPIDQPAFYSYAYPTPKDFNKAVVKPDAAYFESGAGEFILPYETVRTAPDPAATLMAFLDSTYRAAADLGNWDRQLECPFGGLGHPRPPHP